MSKTAQQKKRMAIGAALLAGTVAASVVYLLYVRPKWRRYVVEIGHHILNVAGSMGSATSETDEIEY